MKLLKKIQENVFRHELFDRGNKIVVGVSGGPDSVCLLDALYKLKGKYNLNLIVAHVNYGLRGKDSEVDKKFVRDLAKKYKLPVETLVASCKLQATHSEESLRKIRYKFFEQARKKHRADLVAVGHNLNDQAETVLMRILRGTGLRGLGAIKFRNKDIVRPLLNISRKEIIAYLRKNKISYRLDKTNLGTDFTRNKIRNKLLPIIEKNFNPNIQEVLFNFSQSAGDDYDFISRYASEWLSGNKSLKISALNKLHPAIRHEALRQAIEKHSPSLRDIEAAHIDEILKILKSNKNKRQKITLKGLKIERRGDRLTISRNI